MKNVVTFCSLFFLSLYAFGGTKVPVSGLIDWNNASHWSPEGVPTNGDDVLIPAGYVVNVKHKIYASKPNLTITVYGIIQFDGSGVLDLGAASIIHLKTSEATITSLKKSSSEKIIIDGITKYDGKNDVTINGPAYASATTGSSSSGGGFSTSPLPVTLTHFAAKARNGAVVVTWQTAMEENAHYFAIERSVDAMQWQVLATVPTRGANTSYSYTDAAPLATTGYYRLKMVDHDETFAYSPVAKVAGQATTALQLGPNPASAYLNVSLATPGSQLLQLQVFTAGGQLLKQMPAAATGYTRLSLEGVSRGSYYLVVKDGAQLLESRPFVVR